MPIEAIIVSVVFGALFVGVIVFTVITAVRRVKHSKELEQISAEAYYSRKNTDGNGRTEQQNEYLRKLRSRKAERDVTTDTHSHTGKAERYEPIVGSLGGVSDEGCGELDGVRLVEHDEAYCDDESHAEVADYSDLQNAIVMGEVLNNPRFKTPPVKR